MPEKRIELAETDKEKLSKEEELLREKYDINFEARKKKIAESTIQESYSIENNTQKNSVYMTEIKEEKWYKKIINKILCFFHIK